VLRRWPIWLLEGFVCAVAAIAQIIGIFAIGLA
jgi:hypothetical protein